MKTIKFRKALVPLVLSGEKNATWRLFDDKNFQVGDEVELIIWETGDVFAKGVVTGIKEKQLREIEDADFDGHEKFESEEKMYEIYRSYYGEKVTPESVVKMIKFQLKK